MLDGATEHVLATSELSVASDATVPRWSGHIFNAVWHLVYAALEAEVKAESDKPVDALDVRGLSFRAYVDWHQHRGRAGQGIARLVCRAQYGLVHLVESRGWLFLRALPPR